MEKVRPGVGGYTRGPAERQDLWCLGTVRGEALFYEECDFKGMGDEFLEGLAVDSPFVVFYINYPPPPNLWH